MLSRIWAWLGLNRSTASDVQGPFAGDGVVRRVAIIGAGVGGASAAFFLKQSLGNTVQIDVFEGDQIGGRARSFQYEGKVYEVGAAIVYYGNTYFRDIADKVGAKRIKLKDDGSRMSLYNGKEIVYQSSWWPLWSLYQIWKRYGWVPLKYANLAKKEFLTRFKMIYKHLGAGKAYASPKEMLEDVNMFEYTQTTARELLMDKFGDYRGAVPFANELAAAVNRVNYNQGMGINAFAGLVSYLPVADENLFRLEEGNDAYAKLALEFANAQVTAAVVQKVSKHSDSTYDLEVKQKSGMSLHTQYDAVILAAPLETANLQFQGMDPPSIPSRKYQTTVTTYIRGKVKPSYFNAEWLPKRSSIFMTEMANVPFTSLAYKEQYKDGTQLYKVFSSTPLAKDLLKEMFDNPVVLESKSWLAYPVFNSPEEFAPYVLDSGFFYNNTVENSASAMEMSAIAAKNVVNCLIKYMVEKDHLQE